MQKVFIVLGMVSLLMFTDFNSSLAVDKGHSNLKAMVEVSDLIGRWDITVDENGKPAPSWLEVKLSGTKTLVGYFVGTTGSTRPISKINFGNGKFSFVIPPQWEAGTQDFVIEGELVGAEIRG